MSSGSLNLRGNIGTWSAQTDNCALCISQSALSISGFLQVNSIVTSAITVFTQTVAPQQNAFGVQIWQSPAQIVLYIKGATGGASYSFPLVLGQSFFFTMTLSATGTAKCYLNGIEKVSGATPGITLGGVNSIRLATSSGVGANFLLSDLAIWNGTQIPISVVGDLRDRLIDPGTAPIPATSWWPLNGPPGGNPAAGQTAMNDAIGPNHFTTIPGAGGLSTGAIYSATTLNFVPSITAGTNYASRSGGMFFMHIGTNPALAPAAPAYPTAIFANPTFKINGNPVDVEGPFWSSTSFSDPWIGYQPHVGPTPIIVVPSDVITFTAPGNWIQASQGIAAAQSGTLGNYAQAYEPGVFTYLGFNPSVADKTFRPGFNTTGTPGAAGGSMKNRFNTGTNPISGALTSSPDGYPLTFTGTGVVSLNVSFSGTNGLGGSFPCPYGVWTLIGDETTPLTPITATLTGNEPSLISGPVITGSGANKKWQWTVSKGVSTYNFQLTLTLTAPLPHSNGQAFTLQNMQLFQGDDTAVNTIDPLADVNDQIKRMMNVAPGVSFNLARFLEGWPNSSHALASDLPPNGLFVEAKLPPPAPNVWTVSEPGRTADRILPIYAVRRYDLSQTPNVYLRANWSNKCVASDQPALGPWMWKPALNSRDYSWSWGGTAPPGTRAVIMEIMFGDAAGNLIDHNLSSGQILSIQSFEANAVSSLGTGTCTSGGSSCWVTGPKTVIVIALGNFGNATDVGQIAAGPPQIIAGNKTATISNAAGISVEQKGALTQTDGNPGIWICLNHALDDAAVASYATRLKSVCPVGTTLYVQISNEVFIGSSTKTVWDQLGYMTGYAWEDTAQTVVHRAGQMHDVIAGIWGSHGKLVRICQPWTVNSAYTTKMLTYAHANSIKIDAIAIAPYVDMDFSPPFKKAAAAIVADMPASIAHPSQGGSGVLMPMAAYQDLVRHHLKYNRTWNGPTGFVAQHVAARNATGYGTGIGTSTFVYDMPKMVIYEGSLTDAIPPGVSTVNAGKPIRPGLSHDFMYHPSYYETIQAFCQFCQQPGPAGTEGFDTGALVSLQTGRTFSTLGTAFVFPDGTNDGSYVALWAVNTYQGQPRGRGLLNKFWAPTAAYGGDGLAHDFENESIQSQSYADWMIAASEVEGTGFLAATGRPDTFSGSVLVIGGPASASLIALGRADTFNGAGLVVGPVSGSLAVTGQRDTFSGAALATASPSSGSLLGLGRADIFAGAASVVGASFGFFSGIGRPDVFAGSAFDVSPGEEIDLGRFRSGDTVRVVYQPTVPPFSAPMANVTCDGSFVGYFVLPTRDGRRFTLDLFLGSPFPSGDYYISIGSANYRFAVVPGGDPAGAIIATYTTRTVNGWLVVAQVESGDLTMGRNPRLVR